MSLSRLVEPIGVKSNYFVDDLIKLNLSSFAILTFKNLNNHLAL